jgi:8-oxo-dGTP diphosphatase
VHVSVGGLLVRRDLRVLLQLRDEKLDILFPGLWTIPAGSLEPGETLEAGAVRELAEETGYLMRDPKPLAVYEGFLPDGTPLRRHVFWDVYDGAQQIHVFEGRAMEFVRLDEIPLRDLVPGNDVIIQSCLAAYEALRSAKP